MSSPRFLWKTPVAHFSTSVNLRHSSLSTTFRISTRPSPSVCRRSLSVILLALRYRACLKISRKVLAVSNRSCATLCKPNWQTRNLQVVHSCHSCRVPLRVPTLGLRLPEKNFGIDGPFPGVSLVILACHGKELGHGRDSSGLCRVS